MARQFPYMFERHEGNSPTPCDTCTNSEGPFHIRILMGEALAGAYCNECATDLVNAMKAKRPALQPVA